MIEEELKAFGLSVGMDLVGIASADAFVRESLFMQERPVHPFEHPDTAERIEPQLVLPGVRSIIAGGISYLSEAPESGERLTGWFSRYCRGRDYHLVLEERLNQVGQWLQARCPQARVMTFVDTGPPLERAIAERAGLGRMGKNTNVIAPRLGSWIFLGEILTDVALRPDAPMSGSICGSCTLCLDVCPTQCLTPWRLDAFRCLGYVNQEGGSVPHEYREVMGPRLFGCDDCQDVCPHNVSARAGLHPEFTPRDGVTLVELLTMSEREFDTRIGPTAAAWRGLLTLQRNAVVALGNSGDEAACPALLATLKREEPLLRSHAAWALGRLARLRPALSSEIRQSLAQHEDADPEVKGEIAMALASLS
ncbi:MAG TPA: tRNA epoxyqueuosine(34) reductase QueG [Candidatus Xenobia bacterium]